MSEKSGMEIIGLMIRVGGLALTILGIVKMVEFIPHLLETLDMAKGSPESIVIAERLPIVLLPTVVGAILNAVGSTLCQNCQYDPADYVSAGEAPEENTTETDTVDCAEEEPKEDKSIEEVPEDEPKEIKPVFTATWKCEYCGSVSEDTRFACASCGAARPY